MTDLYIIDLHKCSIDRVVEEDTELEDKELKEILTTWDAVKEILKRGNDAVIRKKDSGHVVIEDKRTIKHISR